MGILLDLLHLDREYDAEDRLCRISDGAVSAGNLKKGEARRHIERLRRPIDRVKPATVAALQSVGFEVINHG